ncbi:hypothetical protein [Zhongshania sp.]|uniref:hypothetical protein n=1 Tax=Zhongshania sp. TaxID=1971902 RepID=UPI00356B1FA6
MLNQILTIAALAFVQNVAFSLVSRARNRDNHYYHATAAVLSNGLWFATMHHLVATELSAIMAIPYILGTVAGSLFGAGLSMKIEKAIGANT